ncbi:hypothetical protein SVIOM342S_05126 [Streptomyces violaceorubidus]
MQQARIEIRDVSVQDGAGQGHRPQAGREPLLGHGCGDPRLGGAERDGDLADAAAQRIVALHRNVNVRSRVHVFRCVGVGEGRDGGVRPPRRHRTRGVQDEEAAERTEGAEGGVEVHGEQ